MQLENALRIYSSPVLLTEQTRDIQCAVTEETKTEISRESAMSLTWCWGLTFVIWNQLCSHQNTHSTDEKTKGQRDYAWGEAGG